MLWANFLHIYQPHGQSPDILEAVVKQCYQPLLQGIVDHKGTKVTLNVNASLLELFDKYGYHDLIDLLRQGGELGRIEFTGSAKYHALLPFLEPQEALRQLKINDETNRHYLGKAYQPRGVFLPEMAFKPELAPVLEEAGFEWAIIDEIAYNGKVEAVDYTKLYRAKGTDLKLFFRERRTSNLIMSSVVRSRDVLLEVMREELKSDRYMVTGMDGETFGHHRVGLESLLFEIFDTPEFELARISDLLDKYQDVEEVEAVASTWASSEKDIAEGIQFLSWRDPDNEIHKLQWQLRDLVVEQFYKLPEDHKQYGNLRNKLDSALASDQFFWASAKPWWSIEMIEEGGYALLEIIQLQPDVDDKLKAEALDLYHRILALAFEWKRSGKIYEMRQEQNATLRIPFKERTLEAGGEEAGVYRAFIDMMKAEEKQAAARADYEAAVLWRDAVYKIEHKTDIYEAVHAVDLLRTKLPNDQIEETIEKYKAEYRRIRGGQPEQRG